VKKKKKKLDSGTIDALKRLREEKYKRLNGIIPKDFASKLNFEEIKHNGALPREGNGTATER